MIVSIYRPETNLYESDGQGGWTPLRAWNVASVFVPIPDRDVLTRGGFRAIVRNGNHPIHDLIVPDGSRLDQSGRMPFLIIPGGARLDASTALCLAKRRRLGFGLVGRWGSGQAPTSSPLAADRKGAAHA